MTPARRDRSRPATTPRRTPRPTDRPAARAASAAAGRHDHAASAPRPARCAVLTVSDTRGPRDDASGDRAQSLLEAAGHVVIARRFSSDEVPAIRREARALLRAPGLDVLIVTGGTGVAPRDVTPEALAPLMTSMLAGFGERFRAHSEAQVGSAAWLSRAGAGLNRGRLIVMLPGSTRAVALALEELVIPELGHVLRLTGRLTPEE